MKKNVIDLFLISFLALYFEILFIRWIPSSIQIIAFFTNIVLIASFLGLGIGCLLSKLKFKLINLFPFLLLLIVLIITQFKNLEVSARLVQGEILRGQYSPAGINFLYIITILFVFIALFFVPLGQQLGISLKLFPPLTAYSINIFGSILGVAFFSYLSYLMIKPYYWFLAGASLGLWFIARPIQKLLLNIGVCLLALHIVSQLDPNSFWSPYQKIDINAREQEPQDYYIAINNTFLQGAYNFEDKRMLTDPLLKYYKAIYEFPFDLFKPKTVLVLGAGSGNDTAAAIRKGAEEIDAVEIDPFIAQLGRSLHREKPYLSSKVNVYVDDARSFVRQTNKTYDLITFGYLDAHRVLSQFSSVRIDNFIYTKESFADIKQRLKSDGHVVLIFMGFRRWVEEKLISGLKEVFGADLRVIRAASMTPNDTVLLIAGEGVRNLALPDSGYFKFDENYTKSRVFISDDWPYLYIKYRGVPRHYCIILLIILTLSLLGIQSTGKLSWKRFNLHFFFLGAGFLLLETVSITRFALLFGSTWIVNFAVFVSIMIMILLANLVVAKVPRLNLRIVYLALFFSIFLNWLIKPGAYLSFNHFFSVAFSAVMMSLPLFFSGIIFASSFKQAADITGVFAFNLLGAIIGGLCEYLSMASGFSFLYLMAIAMYAISFLGLQDNQKRFCLPFSRGSYIISNHDGSA
jgi:SAM-dependent methyltransferase